MKAWEIQGAFGLENLTMVDKERPSLKLGEVRIQVKAASLNYRDLLMVKGEYNPRQPLPLVPLSDACGVVVEKGEGVTRVEVGDRVAGIFAQGWLSGPANASKVKSTLGGPVSGMLSEEVVLHQEGVVRVPGHLSDVEAATLPCAALTAWRALVVESGVKAGDVVLLQGTGGVSLFGLMFAKMHGARVIMTSSSSAKLERAQALGADEIIHTKTTREWSKRVKELTSGEGVDVVLELGGASSFEQSVLSSRVGGKIILIGRLGGGEANINLVPIFMRNLRVQGILVGSRDHFEDMNRAIEQGGQRPLVDRVFSFDQVPAAFREFEKSEHMGKIAISLS